MSEPSPEPVPGEGEDLIIQVPPADAGGTAEQQPDQPEEAGDGVD